MTILTVRHITTYQYKQPVSFGEHRMMHAPHGRALAEPSRHQAPDGSLYRRPGSRIGDVVSGRVSFIVEGYSGIAGATQSGLIKPIAVASEKRLAEFPNLPTVADTLPGFSATGWQVLVAPLGTPEPIIRRVSEDLRTVVDGPELKQK